MQCREFLIIDIAALVFSKPIKKHRPITLSKSNQRSVPARATLTRTGNTLLDEAFAEIGVNHAPTGSFDGLNQCTVTQGFTA